MDDFRKLVLKTTHVLLSVLNGLPIKKKIINFVVLLDVRFILRRG